MHNPPALPCQASGQPLNLADYAQRFAEVHPALTAVQARIEAERCYYCFDAPCQTACPTGIDVPSFIARIAQDNPRGAAHKILEDNVLGGMCARVCPTEVLCEQACVRNKAEDKPVEIGLLQRYATDHHFQHPTPPLFTRAASTGRCIAVVGAGPAGLSCAHRLALLGHSVVVFDARPKHGGLNEYGLARYKMEDGFAQREIDWLLTIGGIEMRHGTALGRDIQLEQLVGDFDAVFLGLGLAAVNHLGLQEPQARGLRDAVDFIAELRQAQDLSTVAVGAKVVVIGGGMTAVDAAVQSKKLGADHVTMVYRRGPTDMGASSYEQNFARENGVRIEHWAAPAAIVAQDGAVSAVQFTRTTLVDGRLQNTADRFEIEADLVLRAIGQSFVPEAVRAITLQGGRIATDEHGHTNHPKVWAGGDCRHGGKDLTVEAVQHGKLAAIDIDRSLHAAH